MSVVTSPPTGWANITGGGQFKEITNHLEKLIKIPETSSDSLIFARIAGWNLSEIVLEPFKRDFLF